MIASKTKIPYPLQLGALEAFAHPAPGNVFSIPMWGEDGSALVANGFIGLEVSRGLWLKSDFPPASSEYLQRFRALEWQRFRTLTEVDWQPLEDIRGDLYRQAPLAPWTDKHRCAPSPVWRVNGVFLCRLSHLQMIARLPRCEVYLGPMGAASPLLFRFSGGRGMLAADSRLQLSSWEVFTPRRHEDGSLVERSAPIRNPYGAAGSPPETGFFAPVADPGAPDWPPGEMELS